VAEQLGEAVLRVTVDDTAARDSLAALRREIDSVTRTTGTSRGGRSAGGTATGSQAQLSQSIQAERRLQAERAATAAATLKAASAELRASRAARDKRISGAISSGIIGGGFPLLFGQGVGAAIGGGIGGVGGGALGGGFGFGLSVVGTALGAAFDEAINKAKTLATALQDPIGQFDALKQASLLSSKGVERQAQGLIAVGREAEAAALIQADLAQSFGDIEGLTTLTESFDELARTFAALGIATAKFVQGPLTEFLDRLRASLTLTPERQKQIEDTATRLVSQQTGPLGLKGSGFFGAIELQFQGQSFKGSATGVRQDLITFLSRQALEAEKAVGAARTASFSDPAAEQERANILSTQRELIEAQADGYKKQALELQKTLSLQKEALDIANLSARNATEPEIQQRRETGELERLGLQTQLNAVKRDELATQVKVDAQNQLALQSVRQRIAAAQQLGAAEDGVARSTLQTVLNIRAAISEAQRREQEIGAQIDAARIRGGDAGEVEVSRLVGQQQVAAEETKLSLIQGADALARAGRALKEDLKTAELSLLKLTTGDQGLNQYLNPTDRNRRERETFEALLPKLREAQEQFKALTGATRAPEFTGRTADVNRDIIKFIETVNVENRAVNNVTDLRSALLENINAQFELQKALQDLNDKDWNVAVNVASDGSSQVYGDIVNGAISP
jgi:hypothetical protein